jgi:membrane-bound lytic murein transglycosylase B
MSDRRTLLRFAAASALGATPLARAAARFVPYPRRDDVQAFIDEIADRNDLPRAWIEKVLARGRYRATVERLMQPPIPYGQRNWIAYRARYVNETRIRPGVAFAIANRDALARAEQRYGVPADVVIGILGVETIFGRMTGNIRTLDALATLSFDYLRRAPYFRCELEQFLLYVREQAVDPVSILGSFAGAIGIPQFMPTSIRKWAVDFNEDGRIDLMASDADSIGSVANFLAEHGWQRDEPILFDARLAGDSEIAPDAGTDGLVGTLTAGAPWSELAAHGVQTDATLDADMPALLVDLPYIDVNGATQREWRIGTRNFAALLAYNHSYFYATSVVELGAAISARLA